MGYDPRGRGDVPSIHQSALENLRRGTKPVLVFLGAVFGLMALFVGGGLIITQQTMPAPPADSGSAAGAGAGATAGAGAGTASAGPQPTASAAVQARRAVLVAFLTDAVRKNGTRWFPGASAETDGLTYTPLSPGDPGADRPDGLARVPYHGLPTADTDKVLTAVSRGGAVDPAGLTVTASTDTEQGWTVRFTVRVRAATGAPLTGEAEGYTTPSGAPVIIRLVYPKNQTDPQG
ncbi:hypothetical protein [Streptomyces sp. A012304]|uniref:hypothetical protein n=1 Tax=Streptomyces sp. A012304 TaxID=375446 RepID=UPI0022313242|nr:hypothetical protein [Streptomyces sp. A012304]GKQ34421.1 hypothetical protein ALMP_09710 [Streptomyces sp. A012304]